MERDQRQRRRANRRQEESGTESVLPPPLLFTHLVLPCTRYRSVLSSPFPPPSFYFYPLSFLYQVLVNLILGTVLPHFPPSLLPLTPFSCLNV
jgi:hypothetical protein